MISCMEETERQLTAPFPYFGGKRRAVELVWPYFGDVKNYVEPFCGSLAMLLGSPEGKKVETVNDVDGFVVNFWRAVQADPVAVAAWADWPVSEIDLEARHAWLVNRKKRLRWSLEDPDFYDAKTAGWWVWGACAWIGSGWCLGKGPWKSNGVEFVNERQAPIVTEGGISRQLPHIGDAGRGINRKLPHIGDAGRGINRQVCEHSDRSKFILDWFNVISERIRDVRITCGDWARVVTPVVTTRHGITAIFLDPPYGGDIRHGLYQQDFSVAEEVRKWCLENGDNPLLRIVLCGYAGEHDLPGWSVVAGKATNGGYGNSTGNKNYRRETLWISPHCVKSMTKEENRPATDGQGMR